MRAAAVKTPTSAASAKTVRASAVGSVKAATQRVAQVAGITVASLALTFAAQATPDLALGEGVFNNNCAACHAGGKNSVIPEKTLNKAALEQYLAGGFKVESIITQVINGKGAMPAWGNVLDDEEIEAVANYVYNQSNSGAW